MYTIVINALKTTFLKTDLPRGSGWIMGVGSDAKKILLNNLFLIFLQFKERKYFNSLDCLFMLYTG